MATTTKKKSTTTTTSSSIGSRPYSSPNTSSGSKSTSSSSAITKPSTTTTSGSKNSTSSSTAVTKTPTSTPTSKASTSTNNAIQQAAAQTVQQMTGGSSTPTSNVYQQITTPTSSPLNQASQTAVNPSSSVNNAISNAVSQTLQNNLGNQTSSSVYENIVNPSTSPLNQASISDVQNYANNSTGGTHNVLETIYNNASPLAETAALATGANTTGMDVINQLTLDDLIQAISNANSTESALNKAARSAAAIDPNANQMQRTESMLDAMNILSGKSNNAYRVIQNLMKSGYNSSGGGTYLGDELESPDHLNKGRNPEGALLELMAALDSAGLGSRPYSSPNTGSDYASALTGSAVGDTTNLNYKNSSSVSGGGGSRGTTALGSGVTASASPNYLDLLNSQLNEYNNGYNALMQAILNAYNSNYGSLNDAYAAALNALGQNFADTESLLNSRLNSNQQALEDSRKRALQEAYISRMMNEKSIADNLAAYGLSGGATESVLADMRNNYYNNRNNIELNVQNSLKDLLEQYINNLSSARQAYNNGILSAEQNRLSGAQNLSNGLYDSQVQAAANLANQRAAAYENYYNMLAR